MYNVGIDKHGWQTELSRSENTESKVARNQRLGKRLFWNFIISIRNYNACDLRNKQSNRGVGAKRHLFSHMMGLRE
jgi:hypothetical protein